MSDYDQYSDVLPNLEEAIIAHYRDSPELIDAEVETAIAIMKDGISVIPQFLKYG